MKPASIISLIIAVLLIIVGLVTCFIAQNMAQANGEFLFAEEVDGDYRRKEDFTESEISKIKLIADNVEINIYGQVDVYEYEHDGVSQKSDKSYAEFVNFHENYYSINSTNRILSFDEIPDIASMLKFWENNFSFKGIRYLINFKQDIDKDRTKKINIYLTSDKDIKNFDIQSGTCTVNVYNMSTGTDYNITADNLTLNTYRVKTSSMISVNAGKDDKPASSAVLNLSSTIATNLKVNASDLFVNAEQYRCNGETRVVCDTGNILIHTVRNPDALSLDLKTVSGKLTVGDAEVHTPYSRIAADASSGSLSIESISADITISQAVTLEQDTEMFPAEHSSH